MLCVLYVLVETIPYTVEPGMNSSNVIMLLWFRYHFSCGGYEHKQNHTHTCGVTVNNVAAAEAAVQPSQEAALSARRGRRTVASQGDQGEPIHAVLCLCVCSMCTKEKGMSDQPPVL